MPSCPYQATGGRLSSHDGMLVVTRAKDPGKPSHRRQETVTHSACLTACGCPPPARPGGATHSWILCTGSDSQSRGRCLASIGHFVNHSIRRRPASPCKGSAARIFLSSGLSRSSGQARSRATRIWQVDKGKIAWTPKVVSAAVPPIPASARLRHRFSSSTAHTHTARHIAHTPHTAHPLPSTL